MKQTRRHLLDRALLLFRELSSVVDARAERIAGPTLFQNGVLYVLARLVAAGDSRPRDLLPSVHLTSGGLSNLLGRLEQADLITRSAAADDDLRAVVISITPEGRDFERQVSRAVEDGVRAADPVIRELIVVLVETGAAPAPIELSPAPNSATRATLGYVELMLEVADAMSLGDGVDAPDSNAALTLAALDHLGDRRPRFLADLLGLTSGGTSRLIDRLERAGWVQRDRAGLESDHRGVVVSITPNGIAHLEEVHARAANHLDELLGRLRAIWVEVQNSEAA